MDSKAMIDYLKLIEDYLQAEWQKNQDKEVRAEIERIAAEIAELKTRGES